MVSVDTVPSLAAGQKTRCDPEDHLLPQLLRVPDLHLYDGHVPTMEVGDILGLNPWVSGRSRAGLTKP